MAELDPVLSRRVSVREVHHLRPRVHALVLLEVSAAGSDTTLRAHSGRSRRLQNGVVPGAAPQMHHVRVSPRSYPRQYWHTGEPGSCRRRCVPHERTASIPCVVGVFSAREVPSRKVSRRLDASYSSQLHLQRNPPLCGPVTVTGSRSTEPVSCCSSAAGTAGTRAPGWAL